MPGLQLMKNQIDKRVTKYVNRVYRGIQFKAPVVQDF